MTVDERARHQLFVRLEAVLGSEEAGILMEHLPPVGWADVVTKHDLDARLGILAAELRAEWRKDLNEQSHRLIMFGVALNSALAVVVAGMAFAAAKLV